jgi:hypothetical protein
MKGVEFVETPYLRLAAEACGQFRTGSASVFTFVLWNTSQFVAELPFVYLQSGLVDVRPAGAMVVRELKGLRSLTQISPVTMTRVSPGEGLVICEGLLPVAGGTNERVSRFIYMSGAANMPLQKAIALLDRETGFTSCVA